MEQLVWCNGSWRPPPAIRPASPRMVERSKFPPEGWRDSDPPSSSSRLRDRRPRGEPDPAIRHPDHDWLSPPGLAPHHAQPGLDNLSSEECIPKTAQCVV